MIEILHEYGQLILEEGQELPIEENSKKQDANVINQDFSPTFTLPYSPENIDAYNRYGFDKFPCQLYSDGFLIGEYTARIKENNYNLNDGNGSLAIQISTIYDSLRQDMEAKKLPNALDGIYWEIDPSGVSPASGETKIHKWLSQEQNTPSGNYPFLFPEYHLVKNYEGSLLAPDFIEDTLASNEKQGFGNCVPVNHFNNQQPDLPNVTPGTSTAIPTPTRKVLYNVLYDRLTYNMKYFDTQDAAPVSPGVTVAGTGYSHFYANNPEPRRIWGLACPCFPYLWVMEKALAHMGYRLSIEWDQADHKALFEKLLILNNYNIFDLRIRRVEGYVEYWEKIPSFVANWENTAKRTYWVGDDNPVVPTFTSLPGLFSGKVVEHPTYFVIAKNHVPDITVAELLDDFVAKTNMEMIVDQKTVLFRKPLLVQDAENRQYAPQVKSMQNEYRLNIKLSYKYDKTGDDNIPDYEILNDTNDNNDIESTIVPVYLHEDSTGGGNTGFFPFFAAEPSINESRNTVEVWLLKSWKFYDNTVIFPFTPLTWDVSTPTPPTTLTGIEKIDGEYMTVNCTPVCGVYIPYFTLPMVGMYYLKDFALTSIAAWYHPNGRTLKWQDSTGIYELQYRSYLDIFRSKIVHYFSELYSPHSFQRFSHYKFFNFLGRKVFALKRKMTLPLSKNPLIEYEGYESES